MSAGNPEACGGPTTAAVSDAVIGSVPPEHRLKGVAGRSSDADSRGTRVVAAGGSPFLRARWRQSFGWWLSACVLVALGLAVWWPNLSAQWGIIDDHGIIAALGEDGAMSLSEIPRAIMQTEVGSWGKYPRYRPAYYLLQHLEMVAWGNHPRAWYLARMAVFTVGVLVLFRLLAEWLGAVYGLIVVLFVLGADYWADIFAKLGPAEIYAVLGLALYSLGLSRVFRRLRGPEKASGNWLEHGSMILGAVVAMGAKENFLLIALVSVALLTYTFRARAIGVPILVSTGIICSCALAIGGAVLVSMASSGKDIYAQDVTVVSRMHVLHRGVWQAGSVFPVTGGSVLAYLVLGVVTGSYLRFRDRRRLRLFLKLLLWVTGVLAALVLLYLSQFVFYNGVWPKHNRYDFPGVLAVPFFWLVLLVGLCNAVRLLGFGRRGVRLFKIGLCAICLVAVQPAAARERWLEIKGADFGSWLRTAIASSEPMASYRNLNEASWRNRDKTIIFSGTIKAIAEACRKNPKAPVVIESFRPRDYESVASVRAFLVASGVPNPLFLRINGYSRDTARPGLEQGLAEALIAASQGLAPRTGSAFAFAPMSCLDERGEADAIHVNLGRKGIGCGRQFTINN